MKRKSVVKKHPLHVKLLILLIKIPLFILVCGFNAISRNNNKPDIVEDLYSQNPNLFNPNPPNKK